MEAAEGRCEAMRRRMSYGRVESVGGGGGHIVIF